MATEATARAFMSSPHFAVVGASSNPAKFGHKSTYLLHYIPVLPEDPDYTHVNGPHNEPLIILLPLHMTSWITTPLTLQASERCIARQLTRLKSSLRLVPPALHPSNAH